MAHRIRHGWYGIDRPRMCQHRPGPRGINRGIRRTVSGSILREVIQQSDVRRRRPTASERVRQAACLELMDKLVRFNERADADLAVLDTAGDNVHS